VISESEFLNTGFWLRNSRERNHMEDTGIYGRTTLRWMLRKWDGGHGLD